MKVIKADNEILFIIVSTLFWQNFVYNFWDLIASKYIEILRRENWENDILSLQKLLIKSLPIYLNISDISRPFYLKILLV